MLTNDAIKSMTPGDRLKDKGTSASVSGLEVRALAGGEKSFLIYYRTKIGQQRRPKIGTFGEITIGEARRRSKLLLDRVAIGEDPKGDWDNKREQMTVGEVFEILLKQHYDTERFRRSKRYQEVQGLWKNQLEGTFKSTKISDVSKLMVRNWHNTWISKPIVANRALEVLSRVFTFADEHELREPAVNPCKSVQAFTEKKRKRFANDEEIQKIYTALEKRYKEKPQGVTFLILLLLTGARPSTFERAKKSQLKSFEKDNETWGIISFEGKSTDESGELEAVIVPPLGMKLIEKLPPNTSDRVLGITMPHYLWVEVRNEIGCGDLWARDLRRTFATLGMSADIKMTTIGELLNQKSTQTTKRYALLGSKERVEAVETIAGKIGKILDSRQN